MKLNVNLAKLLDIIKSPKLTLIILVFIIIALISASILPLNKAISMVYNSLWFIGLLICLFLSSIYCCFTRIPVKITLSGLFLIHVSISIILAGAFITFIAGDKAFISLYKGQQVNAASRDDGTTLDLPFYFQLKNFVINKHKEKIIHHITITDKNLNRIFSTTFYKKGKFKIPKSLIVLKVLQIVPDFVIDYDGKVKSRSNNWNNPAIKIKFGNIEGWIFANNDYHYSDKWNNYYISYDCLIQGGEIKDFKSSVAIIEKNKVVKEKTIAVNNPLQYRGYNFYQYSYDQDNPDWTGFEVTKDPGVYIVFAGYFLLIAGMMLQLYLASKKCNIAIKTDVNNQPDEVNSL